MAGWKKSKEVKTFFGTFVLWKTNTPDGGYSGTRFVILEKNEGKPWGIGYFSLGQAVKKASSDYGTDFEKHFKKLR